jgi:hypothetical protein
MTVEKFSTDARSRILDIIGARKVGLELLDDDGVAAYQAILDDTSLWERAASEPVQLKVFLGFWFGRHRPIHRHWLYQNLIYSVDGRFTEEQEKLLVQNAFDSERRRFERLKHKFDSASAADSAPRRPAIPEEIRIAVWRRDSGRCVNCGSRERLEYDHIIPLARGGSNTARNIELLCETCNRTKRDDIR